MIIFKKMYRISMQRVKYKILKALSVYRYFINEYIGYISGNKDIAQIVFGD